MTHAAIGLAILALASIGAIRVGVLVWRAMRRAWWTLVFASRSARRSRDLRTQRERNAMLARVALRAEAGVLRGSGGAL